MIHSGAAIAYGLYHQFPEGEDTVSFGVYMLFIGVAMAITVGFRYISMMSRI